MGKGSGMAGSERQEHSHSVFVSLWTGYLLRQSLPPFTYREPPTALRNPAKMFSVPGLQSTPLELALSVPLGSHAHPGTNRNGQGCVGLLTVRPGLPALLQNLTPPHLTARRREEEKGGKRRSERRRETKREEERKEERGGEKRGEKIREEEREEEGGERRRDEEERGR